MKKKKLPKDIQNSNLAEDKDFLVSFNVDIQNNTISNIQLKTDKNLTQTSSKKFKQKNNNSILDDRLQSIWININSLKIDFKYAIIGYELKTGNPIYDYTRLLQTLIQYGYDSSISETWINEFIDIQDTIPDSNFRGIIIMQKDDLDIYKNLKPLSKKDL